MRKSQIILILLVSAVIGSLSAVVTVKLSKSGTVNHVVAAGSSDFLSFLKDTSAVSSTGLNFVYAANAVRPSVVHIKVKYGGGNSSNEDNRSDEDQNQDPLDNFFRRFHGDFNEMPAQQASGSGVIVSNDGYIVTNNHVVENSSTITIVLDDKRSYEAKTIGTDPNSDLALLKIEESGLPFLPIGNSDKLRLGEWVLAIGTPYELTNTVTAGIVSAKARNIGLIQSRGGTGIESFIQTDAAVNPGNSGGALVNLKGELVGINTAIATNSGAFSGYSFAVPVSIVKKVLEDLKKYGEVQRAFLGVDIQDVDSELAKKEDLASIAGVFVRGVNDRSAAKAAGIEKGDVISQINGVGVNSASELIGQVARYRPGDKIKVSYIRDGKTSTVSVVLKSKSGDTKLASTDTKSVRVAQLGATLKSLNEQEKGEFGVVNGVKVMKLETNSVLSENGVEEGFIITSVDKKAVATPADVIKIISKIKNAGVLIEGLTPEGKKAYFAIGL